MIDITFCMFLQLPIHSFHMYHVFSAGAEGDHMACAILPVKGWVEVELSVSGLTMIPAKFWLVDIMTPTATVVVIGCHLLKRFMPMLIKVGYRSGPLLGRNCLNGIVWVIGMMVLGPLTVSLTLRTIQPLAVIQR